MSASLLGWISIQPRYEVLEPLRVMLCNAPLYVPLGSVSYRLLLPLAVGSDNGCLRSGEGLYCAPRCARQTPRLRPSRLEGLERELFLSSALQEL